MAYEYDRFEREEGGGSFLMGLTFTITSFTCTFSFVGMVLVIAAGGSWILPIVGMLVFSAVFAPMGLL